MSPRDVSEHAIPNVERASKLASKIMDRILQFTTGGDLELDSRSLTEMIFEALERQDRVRDDDKHEAALAYADRVRALESELAEAKQARALAEQQCEVMRALANDRANDLEHTQHNAQAEQERLREELELANVTLIANQELAAALRDSTVAALAALHHDEAARAARELFDKFECDGTKKIKAYVVVNGKVSREITTVDCPGCMKCDAGLSTDGGDHADDVA